MEIVRFITAGSVDDGKSTLIGRLLYDTKNLKADVMESVSGKDSAGINLAYITDGLRAERQDGITIDVAYKYFSTQQRKYIITDAPGHFQYTKNLVTGASNVDVIIILIDAQNGISAQTRRHSLVASFLKIKQVVVAINKMDLLDYDESIFKDIKNEYSLIAEKLRLPEVSYIPLSALNGDNLSFHSENMPWYKGSTVIEYLDKCKGKDYQLGSVIRFMVQYVIGNSYYGKVITGKIQIGDELLVNPVGNKVKVEKILQGYNEVQEASAGKSICLFLDNKVKRGNILSSESDIPKCDAEFEAELCWLDSNVSLKTDKKYFLRIGTSGTICQVKEVIHKVDCDTFKENTDAMLITVNEFAKVRIQTNDKIAFDRFETIQETGRGILIDMDTNNTSGAFVIS